MLNLVQYGAADSPRLLIAHGLFGSARNWGVIAKRLSDVFHVSVVDMRNHGQSPRAATQSYPDMAEDLAEVLTRIGPSAVLGHSMGGKAAMVLALSRPDLVKQLVVADIAPVGYDHTQSHLIDFMRKIDLETVGTRSDADRQLAAHVAEDGIRAFLLQSLDVAGKTWRLNLDVLEAEMAKIIGFPKLSGQYDGPTLFLSGGASDYVLPEHRDTIRALFPAARFAKIPGAGHWLHAEKPREFEAAVRVFLSPRPGGE
jgi:pimeloyl-ACP methyl ester carboxylesterase